MKAGPSAKAGLRFGVAPTKNAAEAFGNDRKHGASSSALVSDWWQCQQHYRENQPEVRRRLGCELDIGGLLAKGDIHGELRTN
jgi:hypothetical protein